MHEIVGIIGNCRKFLAKIGQKISPHLTNSCYYQTHAFLKSTGCRSLFFQKFLTPIFKPIHFFCQHFAFCHIIGRELFSPIIPTLQSRECQPAGGPFYYLIGKNVHCISTTLQVYTAKFILEASVSKRNPQRRQDIVDSALLETYHVRAAQ